ncbi:unnamed protein product, partial [Eretmochelys imbricata]
MTVAAGPTWRRPKLHVQPRMKSWAMALKEATRPFDSLLNSSSLRPGASEGEVASAVTLLMQVVKQAMLSTALRSPEMKTQNGRTGSTGVLRLACHRELQCRQRGLRLRAQEETMDIPCDTVTMATTQGFTAVACITYSTLDSIINKTFLSEGNLPAGEKLRNVQLNSQ